MTVTLYHNPRCSKSRQALKLLQDNGHTPVVIEYLKTPPGRPDLEDLISKLGITPRDLLRKGEAVYKELALNDPARSDAELIDAMAEHPILMERPIAVNGDKAVVGRPPEAVLDIV